MNPAILMLLCLALILTIVYYFPPPKASFKSIYAKVPEDTRTALETFRTQKHFKRINAGGAVWNYIDTGGGAESILFLHGMGGSYDIWWQQVDFFKNRYRVISTTYPPLTSLADLSAGIMTILEREGIDSVNIVGSSLGGYFAQYLVKNYPDRIKKAVFANTFPPNTIIAEKAGKMGKILPFLPEWMVLRNLRQTTAKAIYPASGNSELVAAYMREQSYGMMRKAQFVARFQCVLDYFDPPDIEKLKIPVFIIEADNDPLVAENLREMLKSTYPAVPVKTFHDKGHFPYLNDPEEYNRTLERFLSAP